MVTLYARAPSSSALVEPGAPMWAQRMALKMLTFFKLVHPTAPAEMWRTKQADLPPAADWPGCLAVVVDLDTLAVSDGTDWRRLDFGAPI